MADQQGFDDGEHAEIRGMSDQKAEAEAEAVPATEPHPLEPLEAHLNGSSHNAGAAVKALEEWLKAEFAKFKAEITREEADE